MKNTEDHGERLAALETGQRALTASIEDFVRATREAILGIEQQTKQIGKANYPTMLTMVGLALAFALAVLNPIWSWQRAAEERDHKIEQAQTSHQTLPVHPGAEQQLKDVWLMQGMRDKFDADRRAADADMMKCKEEAIDARLKRLEPK